MKKILLILLALTVCVSMCACGDNNDTNNINDTNDSNANNNASSSNGASKDDGSIELTLENYEKYFSIVVDIADSSGEDALYVGVYAQPKSTNFNYNDIVVKATIEGEYLARYDFAPYHDAPNSVVREPFSKEISVELDISGNALERIYVCDILPNWTIQNLYRGNEDKEDSYAILTIVSISGTVTPA